MRIYQDDVLNCDVVWLCGLTNCVLYEKCVALPYSYCCFFLLAFLPRNFTYITVLSTRLFTAACAIIHFLFQTLSKKAMCSTMVHYTRACCWAITSPTINCTSVT